MNRAKFSILLLTGFLLFTSCKQVEHEAPADSSGRDAPAEVSKPGLAQDQTQPLTANDSIAPLIADYLNTRFLKPEDKNVISTADKRFQLYQSDLNNDGKKEAFVYLNSPYFCGTGGCTVLLLSPEQELITRFTVMRPPIFIEPTEKNGWKVLTVQAEGQWKELVYHNGSYPSNATVLEKASYDAPSGHAVIAFDDENQVKTYTF